MNSFVKTFIEENIEAIEHEDWKEICSLWYGAALADQTYHEDYFNELSIILSEIDVPFMQESEAARKSFLKEILQTYLVYESMDLSWGTKDVIHKKDIIDNLASHLGFLEEELIEILDDLAEQMNLVIYESTYQQ